MLKEPSFHSQENPANRGDMEPTILSKPPGFLKDDTGSAPLLLMTRPEQAEKAGLELGLRSPTSTARISCPLPRSQTPARVTAKA